MNSRLGFATLAFGKPYRDMARVFAADLEIHAPDHSLIIATDAVDDFRDCRNVIAFHQAQTGFFDCLNDKRFAVARALESHVEEVVFVDADTRIHQALPARVASDARIVTTYSPLLGEQTRNWMQPECARAVVATAHRFGVDAESTKFILDHIYAVKRDDGREKIFLETWDAVTRWFDFQGVSITDGYCMSIAAAVVGWVPCDQGLRDFAAAGHHDGIGKDMTKRANFAGRIIQRAVLAGRWMIHRRRVAKSIKVPGRI